MSWLHGFARAGSIGALAATAHTVLNLRLLRRAPQDGRRERISVLLPVRNEAGRIRPCLQALSESLAGHDEIELIVVDDQSTDDTAAIVREVLAGRARIVTGTPPPPGWLGKPHACRQAANAADAASTILVFLDADVVLAPHALGRTVALLRSAGLQLVSPYPRQSAHSIAERLVQPLLQWSWATFLPLRLAENSTRPALTAANGQLLAVDAAAYRAAGGHTPVRGAVLDDLALLKSFKASGFRGCVADGTDLASCRMYDGWPALRAGYRKSLWSAFGTPLGAAATQAVLIVLYVFPPLGWLRHRQDPLLAAGTVAGITGRAWVARRVGGRVWPDSATHPVSVLLLGWLTADSWLGRCRGTLRWRGRAL